MKRIDIQSARRRQMVTGLAALCSGGRALAAEPAAAPTAPAAPASASGDCAHQRAVSRGYAPGPFGQIHYRSAGKPGSKPPLLLLHPSPLSSYVFEVFMVAASQDRLVIAPDTPGFGLSDPPSHQPDIADYAAAMLAFVAGLKLGAVDVLGYHTGSATAVEMALQAPAQVRHLVLVGASLFNEAELAAFKRLYVERRIDDIPAALGKRWPTFRDRDWRMVCSPARAMNILLESFRNPDVSRWGHHAALSYPLEAQMRRLSHPTLVLNPEDDLWAYTGRAAQLLKNGRVKDLPGWSHGFLDSQAGEVATMLDAFLAS